jgi:hypothetical protein
MIRAVPTRSTPPLYGLLQTAGLALLLSALACGNYSRGFSSFSQGFTGGDFYGEISTQGSTAEIQKVGFVVSAPGINAQDIDYRFLIFRDQDGNGVYQPGVDPVIARSNPIVYSKIGGEVPNAHFEWAEDDEGIVVAFLLTMPGGKVLTSYQTLAY